VATDGTARVGSPEAVSGVGGSGGGSGGRAGEAVPGGCLVPALRPGGSAEAVHPLPADRRGIVTVGPLVVAVGDPFGLAERRTPVGGPARLVVHPRIVPVRPLPGASAREIRRGATRPARAPRGDDFFALREYEVGDDLRRVHWRSTARTGDLMLRQDELRFAALGTVLLDTRAAAHRGGSFERALEVAASVAAAVVEDGRPLRFLTTGGFDLELDGVGPGGRRGPREGRWAVLMEYLAVVVPDPGGPDRFALAVGSIRRRPSGPLAAVVGHATPAEVAALAGLRARLDVVLIARCAGEVAVPGSEPAVGGAAVGGAAVVPIPPVGDFTGAWNEAVLACSRRDAVRT
jgi:hypothetical protein